jgi:beta-galactosidase
MESFKASERKAFHGLALAVIQSIEKARKISVQATSEGLQGSSLTIDAR